jgi:hypothetical protein
MMLFQQVKKRAQAAQDRAKAAQDQAKAARKVALEAEKDNDAAQKEVQELQRVIEPKRPSCCTPEVSPVKVSCRPTPFFFLALRGTTVRESTAAGVRLVLWCAGVGMAVCHVISFWMFLGVYARSSLSERKSSSPCCRFKV